MPGWSDMFGAPPRALTDEELLRAVQPIPLRPLDIAPEAPAARWTEKPFGQGLAAPATSFSPDNYGAPLSIPFDQLMASLSPPPLMPPNYAGVSGNPANDAGLNPADDWQKRGRDTAATALSALYPQNRPIPVAANQAPAAEAVRRSASGTAFTTGSPGTSDQADQATDSNVELLGRLIFAEAANHYNKPGAYRAMAHTVLNRVGQPGFRNTLQDVILQPNQFNSVGGELWNRAGNPTALTGANALAYAAALYTANEILGGSEYETGDPTGGATYYYSSGNDKIPGRFFPDRINSGILIPTYKAGDFTFLKDTRR